MLVTAITAEVDRHGIFQCDACGRPTFGAAGGHKAGAKVVALCEPHLRELTDVARACSQKLVRVTGQTRQA